MASVTRLLLLRKKILLLILLRRRLKRRNEERRNRRMWDRSQKALFNKLVKDLKLRDSEYFFE